MIKDFLPYEEQDALETICRFHHADDPELIKHLAQFGNWIHEVEQTKVTRLNNQNSAPFLITLLSGMGIYGRHLHRPRKDVPA